MDETPLQRNYDSAPDEAKPHLNMLPMFRKYCCLIIRKICVFDLPPKFLAEWNQGSSLSVIRMHLLVKHYSTPLILERIPSPCHLVC
jgi:hypothetical protein